MTGDIIKKSLVTDCPSRLLDVFADLVYRKSSEGVDISHLSAVDYDPLFKLCDRFLFTSISEELWSQAAANAESESHGISSLLPLATTM